MIDYLTINSGNFIQPIATIVFRLVRERREGVPRKTNEVDLDWILSGILLSVVFFEAGLRWTQSHRVPASAGDTAPMYYEKLRQAYPRLPDFGDVFVVRNVIAHGHVWEITQGNSPLWFAKFLMGRQDKQWQKYVATGGTKTISGLNLIPSVMNRCDFRNVLARVIDAMQALVKENLMIANLLNHHPTWPGGERIYFPELFTRIQ